jgi:enoyl-CoA hydratase/carnithine racemase
VWGGRTLFAAGADIKAMAAAGRDGIGPWVSALGAAFDAVARSSRVTIAAINGFALGAGCELALACDLRYAADDAELAQPEVLLGVMPGAGGTQRLPRLVGVGRATEMILTGRRVSAGEARSIGLVHHVVPPDDVYDAAVEAARGFARGPALALAAAKAAIGRPDADLAEGLERERDAFGGLFDTHDQREGMAAFLEKRRPIFHPR